MAILSTSEKQDKVISNTFRLFGNVTKETLENMAKVYLDENAILEKHAIKDKVVNSVSKEKTEFKEELVMSILDAETYIENGENILIAKDLASKATK